MHHQHEIYSISLCLQMQIHKFSQLRIRMAIFAVTTISLHLVVKLSLWLYPVISTPANSSLHRSRVIMFAYILISFQLLNLIARKNTNSSCRKQCWISHNLRNNVFDANCFDIVTVTFQYCAIIQDFWRLLKQHCIGQATAIPNNIK